MVKIFIDKALGVLYNEKVDSLHCRCKLSKGEVRQLDLIFLDTRLPDVDGGGTRKLEKTLPGATVVMTSGHFAQ